MTPDVSIKFRWLLRLRWGALALGAVAIVFSVVVLNSSLPLTRLGIVIACATALNVLWTLRRQPDSERLLGLQLLIDVVTLSLLLLWSGGGANPFSILFIVQVAIAAMILPPVWQWGLTAVTSLAFGSLLVFGPAPHIHGGDAGAFAGHLQGMWAAFTLTAVVISVFVGRLAAELTRARAEKASLDRFVALGTLAAGTAHELNTPLGTVAVLASEISEITESSEVRKHADVIREQVQRCKAIVSQILSPTPTGAAISVDLAHLVGEIVNEWRTAHPSQEVVVDGVRSVAVVSPDVLRQALLAVLDNASDAGEMQPITVDVHSSEDEARVIVEDRGMGFSPAAAQHLGEPFFTTKAPGHGTGLGLFVTRSLLGRFGGQVRVARSAAGGASVTLALPLEKAT